MIAAEFDYLKASSVDEALSLLVEHGEDAKLLAGGHSLLPLMKLRFARPAVLVDIRTLPELRGIREDGGRLLISAATRHRELERHPLVNLMAPLLAYAASTIGDPQVRSRGTIGGSIAHADPAADLPAVLLALDAVITVRGPTGRRDIPVDSFFVDFWQTAVQPDEIIELIAIPSAEDRAWSYQKFRQRSQDWAIVGVAALGGSAPRITLINMALTPMRAAGVERALAEGAPAVEAAQLADEETTPSSDLRADVAYRRHLSRTLTRRALEKIAV